MLALLKAFLVRNLLSINAFLAACSTSSSVDAFDNFLAILRFIVHDELVVLERETEKRSDVVVKVLDRERALWGVGGFNEPSLVRPGSSTVGLRAVFAPGCKDGLADLNFKSSKLEANICALPEDIIEAPLLEVMPTLPRLCFKFDRFEHSKGGLVGITIAISSEEACVVGNAALRARFTFDLSASLHVDGSGSALGPGRASSAVTGSGGVGSRCHCWLIVS
jgi:hypothetical protein